MMHIRDAADGGDGVSALDPNYRIPNFWRQKRPITRPHKNRMQREYVSMIEKNQTTADADGFRIRMIAVQTAKIMGPISENGIHLRTDADSAGTAMLSSIYDPGMKHPTASCPKMQTIDLLGY